METPEFMETAGVIAAVGLGVNNVHQIMSDHDAYLDARYRYELEEIMADPELRECYENDHDWTHGQDHRIYYFFLFDRCRKEQDARIKAAAEQNQQTQHDQPANGENHAAEGNQGENVGDHQRQDQVDAIDEQHNDGFAGVKLPQVDVTPFAVLAPLAGFLGSTAGQAMRQTQ